RVAPRTARGRSRAVDLRAGHAREGGTHRGQARSRHGGRPARGPREARALVLRREDQPDGEAGAVRWARRVADAGRQPRALTAAPARAFLRSSLSTRPAAGRASPSRWRPHAAVGAETPADPRAAGRRGPRPPPAAEGGDRALGRVQA